MATVLFCSLALLTGCGGTSSADAQIPTKAELTQCISEAGGEPWSQIPTLPPGFPPVKPEVVMVGPYAAHISYYVDKRPVFSQKTIKEFGEIQEYQAYPRFNGRVLVLLDPDITPKDKELAFSCLER
jgi:hypothetical protein